MKSIVKFTFNIIVYILVFIVAVFTVFEIYFRIKPMQPWDKYYWNIIKPRLSSTWSIGDGNNPLMPPFKVFANRDFDDIQRLYFIAKEAGFPINSKFAAVDFLRPDKDLEKTRYTANINNLGFRDPPRNPEKPDNVYRIIALGSYQTFGHAVDDSDTYPQQLEKIINGMRIGNLKYEVWNGGRHAGPAIVGLAKLRTEILKYEPDLIIWDYGSIDAFIRNDNHSSAVISFPNHGIYAPIKWALRQIKNLISWACYATLPRLENYWSHINTKENMAACDKIYREMAEITKNKHIPVIILRQSMVPIFIPNSFFTKLSEAYPHVYFADSQDAFKMYPPSLALVKEFRSEDNWLSEFSNDLLENKGYDMPEYFTNYLRHNNKWGHKAVARYLAGIVMRILTKGRAH